MGRPGGDAGERGAPEVWGCCSSSGTEMKCDIAAQPGCDASPCAARFASFAAHPAEKDARGRRPAGGHGAFAANRVQGHRQPSPASARSQEVKL
ncbi:hypothetical protein SKAU_G00318580 [Synaphobranchus kaupii]|uniref:Uncharacterized protein n=1 Tax=Synaphobranchus kaupii TaxID=118154 RepID=A0A9Q1IJV2_SYNKA|nr:hypothetical protein SKAU_G00318580 [Synaphobranchus kaupii]